MEIKIKHLLYTILVLIIGIISFVIVKRIKGSKNRELKSIDVNVEETKYSEYVYYGPNSYTSWELGYEVAKKNGDWSRLPLTNEFKEKYNESDGILGDLEFDKIELAPYDNNIEYSNKYYFVNRNCYFVISRGKEKIAYIYNLKYDGELLSDVVVKDICNLTNEYGEELNVNGYAITNNNFKDSMDFLANGGNDEKSVAVTDNFHRKYPFFLDIFEHYSPSTYNPIEFVPERSSWDRKEAYFIVDSKLECKKRHYKVNFTLDNRGYLDDVEVKKVNEVEYEVEALGWDYWRDHISPILVLVYKNSNYNLIKSTENFRAKYNEKKKVFNDVYVNDYKYYDKLLCLMLNSGNKYYFIDVTLLDDEETIDDIAIKELQYGNISFEEAKELYLKEHNK